MGQLVYTKAYFVKVCHILGEVETTGTNIFYEEFLCL